jgi:hypothetical protein
MGADPFGGSSASGGTQLSLQAVLRAFCHSASTWHGQSKFRAIDDAIRRFDPLGANIKPDVREQVTTIALEVEQLV